MRAFLIAAGVALALGTLAACGSQAPVASDQGRRTSQTGQSTAPTKPAPTKPAPSTVVEPTPGRQPSGPGPVTIGPNGPVVPPGVTEVPPARVDASALPNYFEYGNRVWAFDNALQFFASASTACTGVQARVVDQSSDTVKITVQPMDRPQGGRPDDGPCAMVMTPQSVTVTLDAPLGDRRVVLSAGR